MKVALPGWGGQVEIADEDMRFHDPKDCEGEFCCIHNPSDHHMGEWPINVRLDNSALVERICPHGIGHPDPDSVAYFERQGITYMGVHGCDGCCAHE